MRHGRTCFTSCVTATVLMVSAAAMPATAAAPPSAPGGAGPTKTEASKRQSAFDEVLDHVRAAAASGDWAKGAWEDPVLKRGLADLVEQLGRATGRDDLSIPVDFDDVRPAAPDPGQQLTAQLWVGQDGSFGHTTGSIILADGNVRVAFAEDCVIVARGAVEISHGEHNLVVAGQFIHVSHDGNHGQDPGRAARGGSVLVSGGYVDVSHALDTTCSAARLVRISHADGVTVVNSPKLETSSQKNCAEVKADKLALAPPDKPNPLEGRIRLSQVVHSDSVGRRFAVLDQGGAEVVLRQGAAIRDGTGKPLPELADWKLTFVCEDFALFSDGRREAGFMVPRRPRREE